jgi:preprotein translocase subunit SecB
MTDTDVAAGQENGQALAEPGIRVLAQYIRDLSFENPRAPTWKAPR